MNYIYKIVLSKLGPYNKYNILAFIPLGFCAGLPLPLIGATMSARLMDSGLSLTSIGLFALAGTPYALKFLWSPLVDTIKIPFLNNLLGKRRSWLLLTQIILFIFFFIISNINPLEDLYMLALMVCSAAFISATQDIALDAYRIELHSEKELAAGIATYVLGYRIALIVGGAGALYLAEFMSWHLAFIIMSLCFLVGPIILLFLPNNSIIDNSEKQSINFANFIQWIKKAVLDPFIEFSQRQSWVWILIFIAIYKLGDALAGNMTTPFLLDIGFSKIQIANIVKVIGLAATLIGLFLGGLLVSKYNIIYVLFIGGFLQMFSNLFFAFQGIVGVNTNVLMLTISIENLAGGIGTAAFLAYLSKLVDPRYIATQFALLTSFMALSRTQLSAPAGWMVEGINWESLIIFISQFININLESGLDSNIKWILFFIMTTILAIPGLLIINKGTKNFKY
ncbi:MAG: MFS transporter [Gammaproteobacteria bacterium]|jgi:PAT family beta-lactamase induction signal transducer AmpG|nr:MFS transporter [Pelagibacterales bacterium]MBT4108914.1 MFS transporter [Pelagibacterales bacterium]MBT7543156.1 MFS transporter [Gammaproteobacteria bacterium]